MTTRNTSRSPAVSVRTEASNVRSFVIYPTRGTIHTMDGEQQVVKERASVGQVIHHRNYQRARARALARLSRVYKDQYKLFLQEERERDEELGKTWVGIDLSTGSPVTIESYKDAIEGSTYTDPDYQGENQGDDGGEA